MRFRTSSRLLRIDQDEPYPPFGNDLIANLGIPLQSGNANLMGKLKYLWETAKHRYRGPIGHEVWCDQPISYQTGARNLMEQINSEKP